ncbi:unnamed protein product [Discosporangium mesarthrocarpum]
MGDRFPTYRLENHSLSMVFYSQVSVPGPGDALPPGKTCIFGWDQPCPADMKMLRLNLSSEPLSSVEGKRLCKSVDIRRLGERSQLITARGRLEVVVQPDGPCKVVHIHQGKTSLFSHSPTSQWPDLAAQSSDRSSRGSTHSHQADRSMGMSVHFPLRTDPSSTAPASGQQDRSKGGALKRDRQVHRSLDGTRSGRGPGELTSTVYQNDLLVSPELISSPPRVQRQAGGYGIIGLNKHDAASWTDNDKEDNVSVYQVYCKAVLVSVIDGSFGEMMLGSLEELDVRLAATPLELEVHGGLRSLQIDSHMPGTSFPVLLQPVQLGDEAGECIQFTLRSAPHVKNVLYVKLASLAVKELDVRLDEAMVRWAQDFVDRVMWQLRADKRSFDHDMDSWPLPLEAFAEQVWWGDEGVPGNHPWGSVGGHFDPKGMEERAVVRGSVPGQDDSHTPYVYLEAFQVSSLKVRLSLQRGKESAETVYVGVKPGQMLLDLMMRMDSAHVKLNSFGLRNETTTKERLLATAREHYVRELKQHAFQLLGALEAFGNPVGLMRGMGQGIQDFVVEPFAGLKRSVSEANPEELVAGFARGTGSLLKHSVGGVANSASLITGTVSQNLTTFTMDKEYKVRRAKRMEKRGSPVHLIDGIGSAGGSLADGLKDGVSDLIKNPIKGAESGGFAGFAYGVGTGVLGLVVKPVVGVFDAGRDVLQGVSGTTHELARMGKSSAMSSQRYHHQHGGTSSLGQMGTGSSTRGGVSQVRPRRVLYGRARALQSYVLEDAAVGVLLQSTRFKDEEYAAHLLFSNPPGRVVVVTHRLVLVIEENRTVLLAERLDCVQVVERTHDGILLHLHPRNSNIKRLLHSSHVPGLPPTPLELGEGQYGKSNRPVTLRIACPDNGVVPHLYDMVSSAVKEVSRYR